MKKRTTTFLCVTIVIVFLPVLRPSVATAGLPIEFTHDGIGEGTLNGVPFGPSDFTITAFGDIGDREEFTNGFFIEHFSAMIEIDGVGSFGILTPTLTFVNQASSRVGFARAPSGLDLLTGPTDPDFALWDMRTSIGPISGNDGRLVQWDLDPQIETTGGILYFFDAEDVPVTFTAEVIPGAPAPLCLLPAAFVLCPRRRRRC